jgi:hypothetical protein
MRCKQASSVWREADEPYLKEGFDLYDTVKRTGKFSRSAHKVVLIPSGTKPLNGFAPEKSDRSHGRKARIAGTIIRRANGRIRTIPGASTENLDWNRWLYKVPKMHSIRITTSVGTSTTLQLGHHRKSSAAPFSIRLQLATGDPQFPRRVCCTGTRKISLDREITDTTHILAEFPSGLTMVIAGSTVNEQGLPEMIPRPQGHDLFSRRRRTNATSVRNDHSRMNWKRKVSALK